eukprot:1160247-Pelagomonas_calceolata.AAC.14
MVPSHLRPACADLVCPRVRSIVGAWDGPKTTLKCSPVTSSAAPADADGQGRSWLHCRMCKASTIFAHADTEGQVGSR